jgi:hypothetical protein
VKVQYLKVIFNPNGKPFQFDFKRDESGFLIMKPTNRITISINGSVIQYRRGVETIISLDYLNALLEFGSYVSLRIIGGATKKEYDKLLAQGNKRLRKALKRYRRKL